MELLVGRAREVRELQRALEHHHAVAVIGPGGIGKSTLARHVVQSSARNFPGGVHFMHGHEIGRSPGDIFGHLLEQLAKSAESGPALLVIDGADELPRHTAEELLRLAQNMRGTGTDLRLLVTSRGQVLGVDATITLGSLGKEAVTRLMNHLGLAEVIVPAFIEALGGHPLAVSLAAAAIRAGGFTASEFLSHLRQFESSGIILPDGKPLDIRATPAPKLRVELTAINDELLRALRRDIGIAHQLSPRKFEELVAELLARQGYAVELTPASKDGGKDIYVAKRSDLGSFMYLVECKKYALENPVGVEIVRGLYGTVQAERATAGVLVTTSVFTKGARDFQRHVEYQLSLRDYAELHRWVHQVSSGRGGV